MFKWARLNGKWREINRDKVMRERCLAFAANVVHKIHLWTGKASGKMMTIIFISPLDVSMHTIHFDWALWSGFLAFCSPNTPIHYVSCIIVFSCFFFPARKLLCSIIFLEWYRILIKIVTAMRLVPNQNERMNKHKALAATFVQWPNPATYLWTADSFRYIHEIYDMP